NTSFAARMPPWQVISTTSSRVKLRGARMTETRTSSTACPLYETWPKCTVWVGANEGLGELLLAGLKHRSATVKASDPEIRITASPASPIGVEIAAMVSENMGTVYRVTKLPGYTIHQH